MNQSTKMYHLQLLWLDFSIILVSQVKQPYELWHNLVVLNIIQWGLGHMKICQKVFLLSFQHSDHSPATIILCISINTDKYTHKDLLPPTCSSLSPLLSHMVTLHQNTNSPGIQIQDLQYHLFAVKLLPSVYSIEWFSVHSFSKFTKYSPSVGFIIKGTQVLKRQKY